MRRLSMSTHVTKSGSYYRFTNRYDHINETDMHLFTHYCGVDCLFHSANALTVTYNL